jgi:hypothetical protein
VQQESKKNKQKKSFWFLRFLFEKKAKHKKLENINLYGFLSFSVERKQNATTKKDKSFWAFQTVNLIKTTMQQN